MVPEALYLQAQAILQSGGRRERNQQHPSSWWHRRWWRALAVKGKSWSDLDLDLDLYCGELALVLLVPRLAG